MDPEKNKRLIRIISQVASAGVGIFLVYAWGLNREHTTIDNIGFCASMLLVVAVFYMINRKYR